MEEYEGVPVPFENDVRGQIEARRLKRGGPLRRAIAVILRELRCRNVPFQTVQPSTWTTYDSYLTFDVPLSVLQAYWIGGTVQSIEMMVFAKKTHVEAHAYKYRHLSDAEYAARVAALREKLRVCVSEANLIY